MRFRLCLLAFCFTLALQAQIQMNVQQLADFVRSELALKQHTDKQIAVYVKKLQLTEKLPSNTITDLVAQGAGPKTEEALRQLQQQTASLKAPTHEATSSPATAPDTNLQSGPATVTLSNKPAPAPPPDSVHQQQILDLMKQYALSYTQNLPNFFCVQVTRQAVAPRGGENYQTIGNILSRVSYNEGREKYSVYSVNGKMVDTSMENIRGGGAISQGEFGSLMREIFESRSEAEFGWDHWARLRGRTMAVFNYFIDSGHSSWSISYSYGPNASDEQHIVTAYKGLIYADANTGEIDRIKFVAVDIPNTFPVREATEVLDYDLVQISGQQYVVPLRALLLMRSSHERTRNEIEFRNYRKFGTESIITYDMDPNAPAPLPNSKTEEQPLSAAPTQALSETARPGQTNAAKATPAAPAASSNGGSNPWTLPAPPPPPPQQ